MSVDRNEAIGRAVEGMIRVPAAADVIGEATIGARAILASDGDRLAGTVAIPLDVFGPDLPPELKSCRLSVMRGGTAYKVERHPNGTQYVYSLEDTGTISIFHGSQWHTTGLASDPGASLGTRWHVVPANSWHQPIPGARDWVVLAFHSAPSSELIDDYGYDGPPQQY